MSKKPNSESDRILIINNRKARFAYHILDRFEAGIQLTGQEIKAVREHHASIEESYVRPQDGEVFWIGAHIRPYSLSDTWEYNPTRARKLLLHKHEIDKIRGMVETKGLTVVPLQLYIKNGKAKLEIALARGKDAPDKRDSIREREGQREAARAMKKR